MLMERELKQVHPDRKGSFWHTPGNLEVGRKYFLGVEGPSPSRKSASRRVTNVSRQKILNANWNRTPGLLWRSGHDLLDKGMPGQLVP